MTGWNEIRNKYITTTTSYRKLAAEYGIDQAIIARKGKDEKWVDARKQYVGEVSARIIEQSKVAEVDRAKKMQTVADKLLNKIEALADRPGMLPKDIRSLVAAVKDLKEIQGVKSSMDKQEQEARIANLQKQAQKGAESKEITVEMSEELEEYSG